MENYNFDLLESPFQFNTKIGKTRRRSLIGLIFSIIIYGTLILFFIYLCMLYFENKIDPKYISQTFYSNQSNKLELNNNFFGYKFQLLSNQSQQIPKVNDDQVYIVFLPFLHIQSASGSQIINLHTNKCLEPVSNEFECIDFSQQNYLEENLIDNTQINLIIRAYRCSDVDDYKLTIPDNCAKPEEIDSLFDSENTPLFYMKMITSQYNTISQQIQNSYKNIEIQLQNKKIYSSVISVIKQIIKVTKGQFFQKEVIIEQPVDYEIQERDQISTTQNKSNEVKYIANINIQLSEKIQITTITYASFFEIVSIWNSLFIFLTGIVFVGRIFVNKLVLEDISLVFLRNVYQSTYLNYLDLNKIFRKREIRQLRLLPAEDLTEKNENINVPSIVTKKLKLLDPCHCQNKGQQDSVIEICDSRRASILLQNNISNIQEVRKDSENYGSSQKEPIFNTLLNEQMQLALSESNYFGQTKIQTKELSNTFWKKDSNKTKNPLSPFKLTNSIKIKENNNTNQQINNQFQSGKSLYISQGIKTQNRIESRIDNFYDNNLGISQYCALKLENAESCTENLYAIQNNTFSTKLRQIIYKIINLFKFKTIIRGNQQNSKKYQLDERQKIQSVLKEKVKKHLDILQIYKDLIILKKAIMILLSKDQYAALLLTGCSMTQKEMNFSHHNLETNQKINNEEISQRTSPQDGPLLNLKGKSVQMIQESQFNKFMEKNQYNQYGHLDQQFQISESEKWQAQYLNVFLQRCKENQNLSELDKRILSSLTL